MPAPPPPIVTKGAVEYEVAKILDSRARRGKTQYLVSWKGYPTEDNSWEPAATITEDVPALVKRFHMDHPGAIRATHVAASWSTSPSATPPGLRPNNTHRDILP